MGDRIDVETVGGTAQTGGSGLSFLLTALGVCSIGFGVLVVVFPKLIAWMVALFFGFVGLGLLLAARAVRRWRRRFSVFEQGFQGPFPGR